MVHQDLIDGCIRGERRAQYALYKALHPMMIAICTRYERDRLEATALMNQGFLKVLDNLKGRPDHVPFEPWVRRITINTVIDAFRRSKDRRAHVDAHAKVEDTSASDVNAYLVEMEAEAFAEMLLALPPMSRNVFNLFAIDGFSHAEIAELLSISEGTSKWHVNHARKLLREAIGRMVGTRPLKTHVP
ncbi:MAG: sigma-70 family RNA polymerase sigma factor [Flavobacteriales bacterium]|nr:sigma-70 family RNA polymerase sigma factor [Flavobacteriales bacterium]